MGEEKNQSTENQWGVEKYFYQTTETLGDVGDSALSLSSAGIKPKLNPCQKQENELSKNCVCIAIYCFANVP